MDTSFLLAVLLVLSVLVAVAILTAEFAARLFLDASEDPHVSATKPGGREDSGPSAHPR